MTTATESSTFRSGFIALIGKPNAGKSTLLNAIMLHNLAAVSSKPQTTRRAQAAILTLEHAQLIFMDTPGLHEPVHKLGQLMNRTAKSVLLDADMQLVIFDLSTPPSQEDLLITGLLQGESDRVPRCGLLNKVDLVPQSLILQRTDEYQQLLPDIDLTPICALRGVDRSLINQWADSLPPGPMYYPEDQITVEYERDIAAEMIRSAAMENLHQEVPHSIAVRIDQYKERSEELAYIEATLFVERESQKGIVIGKQGSMLRKIGSAARKQIEDMSGRKVYLKIKVKVLPGWRDDDNNLKQLGY